MKKAYLISYFEIAKWSYQNTHSSGPEIYFDKPCIGYIKKGHVKFFYKGNTIYAYEGDVIYIGSETRYQSIWYGSPDIEWYSVNLDFNSKYAFYDYGFQILRNYPEKLFKKMYQAYDTSPFIAVSYLYCILDDIYGKLTKNRNNNSAFAIEPAIRHIENNYNKQISIKMMADMCHMSESGFFKQFKNATGVTPIAYKHNIMIQHAIDMLVNTSISIEEISNLAGFPSSNYFRKIFYKLTDKKPKEIRRKP